MRFKSHQKNTAGFAAVEALLIVIIVAAVIGIGAYVIHQKNTANKTVSTATSQPNPPAAPGTTSSIDQLTQNDSQTETSVDSSSDTQIQSSINSANSSTSNVGGAYNENNL